MQNDLQSKLDKLNKDLNPEQKIAAETLSGPVIVIAGAGAGKTKTLIHRVASLLVSGVHPSSILVVTFTNLAAQEIKERLTLMVGSEAQHINAGTFHSIVFKEIIKKNHDSRYLKSINLDASEAAIIDEQAATQLFKEAIRSLDQDTLLQVDENEWKFQDFQKEIGSARAVGHDVTEYLSTITSADKKEEFRRVTAKIWSKYSKLCRQNNAVDFDDILLFADKMLKAEPDIAKDLAGVFKSVMLDEYQDTNRVQMNIMDSICQHHQNIFVVGDEKQSIYGFRHADIKVILGFKQRYKGAKQIDMKRNYRSYPSIIESANGCASAMNERLSDGQLIPMAKVDKDKAVPGNNQVIFKKHKNTLDEADEIVSLIKNDLKKGVPAKEIAILYRNRALKQRIEKRLVEEEIPYKITGDSSFYQKTEVKDIIAMVRFIYNPWDSLAGRRFIGAAKLGVTEKLAKQTMQQDGINTHEFLLRKSKETLKASKKGEPELRQHAKKISAFLNLAEHIRACTTEHFDKPEFIVELLGKCWDIFMKPKLAAALSSDKETAAKADDKLENIAYILKRIQKELEANPHIEDALENLALLIENNGELNKDSDTNIQMMTMHGSKGLEFDKTYIIGADNMSMEGDLPVTGTPLPEVEEARRLLYVAMTRAKKSLYVSVSKERMHHGEFISVTHSQFLQEIMNRTNIKFCENDTVLEAESLFEMT